MQWHRGGHPYQDPPRGLFFFLPFPVRNASSLPPHDRHGLNVRKRSPNTGQTRSCRLKGRGFTVCIVLCFGLTAVHPVVRCAIPVNIAGY
jgi:hypothetical protein